MLNLNFQNGTTPALNARNMNAIVESINTLDSTVTENYTETSQRINTLTGSVDDLRTQIASPFTFKGTVATVSSLPSSGNTINDTYFVEDQNCLYSWNGTAWSQSSYDADGYAQDLADLKSAFNPIENDSKREFITGHFIDSNGVESSSTASYASTDYIPCSVDSIIQLRDIYCGESSYAYTFYNDNKERISGQNNVFGTINVTPIPPTAKYVRFSSRITNETPVAIVCNQKTLESGFGALVDAVDVLPKTIKVEPKNTTFFSAINYFDVNTAVMYSDRFLQPTTMKITSSSQAKMLVFDVEPNTEYYMYIPDADRYVVGVNANNDFALGNTFTLLVDPVVQSYPQHFITGESTTKVAIYFKSGDYDYNANKNNIVLNKNTYTGNQTPYIPSNYLPDDLGSVLFGTNILIFGDSITSCCNITINSSHETTAYTWKNPSNSYVDGEGHTVTYSMWPKILKESEPCNEIRDYAQAGASYKTSTREAGYERQNLQYQIDVALNDKNNPNNVFSVDDFAPDIIIFALGTNDGVPADTFDSAMSATVYQSDGVSIDVGATLSALDDTKTIASARKAFMRIKQAFPTAQIYCVLPIQKANDDVNWGTLRAYLKQMAERYGCVIIDGTADSGITRDFNNWNALGTYLKDGLHPNEKGQNMMARMIISALRSHYIPFGYGYNE